MKKTILMVGLLNLMLLAQGKILFTSNFDGHTGVPSTGYVQDISGSASANVTWIRDPVVSAISELTTITNVGGFVNQGKLYSNGNLLKINKNLNSGVEVGYRLTFTLESTASLSRLSVRARHSNDSAEIDQGGVSDLIFTLSGGTLGIPFTDSVSQAYSYRENQPTNSFKTIQFNLMGKTIGAGTYTLTVKMDNLKGIGGAYAIFDGITLEGGTAYRVLPIDDSVGTDSTAIVVTKEPLMVCNLEEIFHSSSEGTEAQSVAGLKLKEVFRF